MNVPKRIEIHLLSDTTFSSGEGTPGIVDIEVEHDELGLPYLGGKTLHGLLRDSWLSMQQCFPDLQNAAVKILGPPADLTESSILHIGNAVLDDAAAPWIKAAQTRKPDHIISAVVLAALTDVRHQTSEDRKTGTPAKATLRSSRVIILSMKFNAPLVWLSLPSLDELRCLALCLLGTRHAGLGRNRGRGHISATIDGDPELTRKLATGGGL